MSTVVTLPRALRPAWVEVDLAAIRANARLLAGLVAPARLCAVVKADAYGHGAPEVAAAALDGGATTVAVALVEEGIALRESGCASEVLLLSEPTARAMGEAVAHGLTPTLYRLDGVVAAQSAAAASGRVVGVQLKVDTGMHRVGADPAAVLEVARAVAEARGLVQTGLWTHFAVAEALDDPFTAEQLDGLDGTRRALIGAGIAPGVVHAANSAGALVHRAARLDLVRCGIALYGHLPSPLLADAVAKELGSGRALVPALEWKAQIHLVRRLDAGERISYGRAYGLERASYVGVVPVGYHDGVPRAYGRSGGEVLVRGRRRPIAGAVTMDQLMVDLGDDASVQVGDEVVLVGRQGAEQVTVSEWADRLGTICHEVLCGIGPRVPRRYVDSGIDHRAADDDPDEARTGSPASPWR
jgi:alanine racemase